MDEREKIYLRNLSNIAKAMQRSPYSRVLTRSSVVDKLIFNFDIIQGLLKTQRFLDSASTVLEPFLA